MLLDPKFETKVKARATLLAAADYIEEHGWCQCALRMNNRVCLMGAIQTVSCGDLFGADPVSLEITQRLQDVTGGLSVTKWNDKPGRTKAQVVAALRRAAR